MPEFIRRISQSGVDLPKLLLFAGCIIAVLIVLTVISRIFFGKNSVLIGSISAIIAVFFVYFTVFMIRTPIFTAHLPFVEVHSKTLIFYDFTGGISAICGHVIRLLLLSFYVSLADHLIPKGKSLLWPVFRVATILASLASYCLTLSLLSAVLPTAIAKHSGIILLGLLLFFLATGSLRFLVGLAISTVNPIIAALFTFFFVTVVGKQILKALLAALFFVGIFLLLRQTGITSLPMNGPLIPAVIPICAGIGALWYFIKKIQ